MMDFIQRIHLEQMDVRDVQKNVYTGEGRVNNSRPKAKHADRAGGHARDSCCTSDQSALLPASDSTALESSRYYSCCQEAEHSRSDPAAIVRCLSSSSVGFPLLLLGLADVQRSATILNRSEADPGSRRDNAHLFLLAACACIIQVHIQITFQ